LSRRSTAKPDQPPSKHQHDHHNSHPPIRLAPFFDTITGNRRGLVVAIPDAIREAVEHIPFDVLIDGEAVGDTLHAFDLLEVKGNCLHQRRYLDRFAGLIMVIPPGLEGLRWVSTAVDPNDKLEIYDEPRSTNREGVVFKDMDAPYTPGRPNSGGPQLKSKFVEKRVVRCHRPTPLLWRCHKWPVSIRRSHQCSTASLHVQKPLFKPVSIRISPRGTFGAGMTPCFEQDDPSVNSAKKSTQSFDQWMEIHT
jgi:hypothetical protein